MKQLLNILYVMTQGAYVSLDHDTVKVDVDKKTVLQVPLLHLGGIVTMGNVLMSPFLMGRCAEDGREVVILDWSGRFSCRMTGPASGNVLLRQAQYEAVRDGERAALIAKNIIAGKVKNSRQVLLRSARESNEASDVEALHAATERLAGLLHRLKGETDLDRIRGLEGEAASIYFLVFDRMVKPEEREPFQMHGRSRRPPLDRINALISFLYTILLNDCVTAAEAVGLDPQMGFVHSLRPGRPSLALDLMEEFRSSVADRLAFTLINRQQITAADFEERAGGAVYLNEKGRKTVVVAYQKRKQEEVEHPLIGEKFPIGLLPHAQARLLARHLRGDMEAYCPYVGS